MKEKVFAWIESLEDMADQSDRYFVERTKLYRENQEKDKEIERLNNIYDDLKKYLEEKIKYMEKHSIERMVAYDDVLFQLKELKEGK